MKDRWGQQWAPGAVIPPPATEVPPPPPPPSGARYFSLTFIATEETPERYRRHHGTRSQLIPADTLIVVEGTLQGIPGRLVGDTWEMTAPWPVPEDLGPPWARKLSEQLAEIRALLADRSAEPS
jgi:hypothetical protein